MNCKRHIANYSASIISENSYGGIPQNFIINIVALSIIVILFILLRKKAWNYGNIAWVNKPIDVHQTLTVEEPLDNSDNNVGHVESLKSLNSNIFWRHLPLFIKMSDKALEKKCGYDSVIYSKFQRNLILIGFVMMVLSMVVIVPVNLSGSLLSNDSQYFKTLTMANINVDSPMMIAHLCVAMFLMLFVFYVTNRFFNFIETKAKEELSYALMITNVPEDYCDSDLIFQHFKEAYPSLTIENVQKTYNIEKLFELFTKKVIAEEALLFCYNELEQKNRRFLVAPNVCGKLCVACQCCENKCKPLDGIEYYSEEVKRITNDFLKEKEKSLTTKNLPIFFVSFTNMKQALQVRREYIYQNYCCIRQVPKSQSSLSETIKPENWKVVFAPASKDILWQNLHKKGWTLLFPIILSNILVAFFVIMLSTPSMALIFYNTYIQKNVEKLSNVAAIPNQWVTQFAPSLFLVIVSAAMPILVCWSNNFSAHWTKTKENIAIMNKLFTVLVLTTLILPALGLNSIAELIQLFINSTAYKTQFECIFMDDGGALFCNYLISAGFIGIGLELLRIGGLLLFLIKVLFSRSRAENNAIAKSLMWQFPFGVNYAWTLALFTIMSAYAVIVPLVTPFGLIYLISKHLVDRYNMIHVNVPSVVKNEVHTNAAKLLQICMIFTQATVTIYVTLHQKEFIIYSVIGISAFIFGIIITFGRSMRQAIQAMAWIKYEDVFDLNDQSRILSSSIRFVNANVEDENKDAFISPPMLGKENIALLEMIERKSMVSTCGNSTQKNPSKVLNSPSVLTNLS